MCTSQEHTNSRHTAARSRLEPVAGALVTKPAAAAQLGWSVAHLNRLLRQGKLKLTEYHLYEGAPSRLAEDEIEALKQGGAF